MACFTKTQQSNGTNCEFEKYVTTSKFFVLNTLDKSHRNSVRAQYVCDKNENARVCAKWQWNALDSCYWIAPVVQSSNTVSCVSLSFRTHLCVLAIWCHQARSHYLKQCWPRFMSPYGVTSPQWVNIESFSLFLLRKHRISSCFLSVLNTEIVQVVEIFPRLWNLSAHLFFISVPLMLMTCQQT